MNEPITLIDLIRDGRMDAELAALAWMLVDGGMPVHVVSDDRPTAATSSGALRALARDPAAVTDGPGAAIEEVLRQPIPLRPATGAVLVLDAGGRVIAAHLHRPPLRDAAGHVRTQGPAVLATWETKLGRWEHFAWGVTPELAAASGRRAGDFELEQQQRREFLEGLAEAESSGPAQITAALAGFGVPRTDH